MRIFFQFEISKLLIIGWSIFSSNAFAFDASKVFEGLYYNATNIGQQLWTPLFIARNGKLEDPFLIAQREGLNALTGLAKTEVLEATTPDLSPGCRPDARLAITKPMTTPVSMVSVAAWSGRSCPGRRDVSINNFKVPRNEQGDDPFPVFNLFTDPDRPELADNWLVGVPGNLGGTRAIIFPRSSQMLGRLPYVVNAAVSRLTFVSQPVVEPNQVSIALMRNEPLPKYTVNLLEAGHRSNKILVSNALIKEALQVLQQAVVPSYREKLRKALPAGVLGGIAREYVELGLIQGIDIDNSRSFDYVGMLRVGTITRQGAWRWVDVVWSWRRAQAAEEGALQIVRTSEPELFDPANGYFSNKNPSLWAPTLVLSGIADFDKDKLLELVTSLERPVGLAQPKTAPAGGSESIDLRHSAVHAWTPGSTNPRMGAWSEVYRTVEHESHTVDIDRTQYNFLSFGK